MKTGETKTLGKGLVLHQFLSSNTEKWKFRRKTNQSRWEEINKKENFDSCGIVCALSHLTAKFDSPKRG